VDGDLDFTSENVVMTFKMLKKGNPICVNWHDVTNTQLVYVLINSKYRLFYKPKNYSKCY
jgi:hypothetical protein